MARLLDRWLPAAVLAVLAVLVTAKVQAVRYEDRYPAWAIEDLTNELGPLLARHAGETKHSQWHEELIIRDFFQGRREGVFLDVGAAHHQLASNTYYLETELGWSGLAIEPQTEFAAGYAAHRPRTRFVPMFASDTVGQNAQMFLSDNKLAASGTKAFSESYGKVTGTVSVPTTTLNHVLDQAGIASLHFASIDIELHEPQALAGFDIQKYAPALVCIEAHPEVRQAILDYFHAHGYVVVGKYLRMDPKNLYFTPARSRR